MSPLYLNANMWQLLRGECVVDQANPEIIIEGPKMIRVQASNQGLLIQAGRIKVSRPVGEDLINAIAKCKEGK